LYNGSTIACVRQSSFHRVVVVFVFVVVVVVVAADAFDDHISDSLGCYVHDSRRFEVTFAFFFMYP
jgi:hypothetical protein